MLKNETEIPVSCPVCRGRALLTTTDRVVQCAEQHPGHKLIFLPAHKFDTLHALGYLPT